MISMSAKFTKFSKSSEVIAAVGGDKKMYSEAEIAVMNRIEENVKASSTARVVMELAMEEACQFHGDHVLHFWTCLLRHLKSVVPEQHWPVRLVPTPVVPMTRSECVAFEMTRIAFGKHAGEFIDEVPLSYLEWLDSQSDFRQQLRQYLASKQVQQHMTVTEEHDEHEL